MDDFRFDSIVIGAGHAGIEAGLALARLGKKTLVLAISLESIGFMACNPSIGGTAKGHLVREIDALGGEMGRAADKTLLQLRMLNSSKGFAVQSLRAQVDKYKYHRYMKNVLENTPNLFLRQGEAVSITQNTFGNSKNSQDNYSDTARNMCYTVETKYLKYYANTVIVCCGVYLKSKILVGNSVQNQGPSGFTNAESLSGSLQKLGIALRRFKTGTPARLKKGSLDLSRLEIQGGENLPYSFSVMSRKTNYNKTVCYLGYTNQKTHQIIADNLALTPRKLGNTEGIGARYCPSIEDKIERFSRDRHQFFLEPEGEGTQEMYIQGISTSLPAAVQLPMYRSIEGFDHAEIMRDAYAIEYDCIDSTVLLPSLMHMDYEGLFFAGQINGTSGYEEAAAQGLVAGINAARLLDGLPPMVLTRDNSYIGVMIDDLVTKGTDEPYRMMTSRAEYRLHLRQDNADLRLTQLGRNNGLVCNKRFRRYQKKMRQIAAVEALAAQKLSIDDLKGINFDSVLNVENPSTNANNNSVLNVENLPFNSNINTVNVENSQILMQNGEVAKKLSAQDFAGLTLEQFIKRHNVTLEMVNSLKILGSYNKDAIRDVFIRFRYEGYLKREEQDRKEQRRLNEMLLPTNIDYNQISGLRTEAAEKLNKIKPHSVGQAGRISGVNPADINVLIVRLKN